MTVRLLNSPRKSARLVSTHYSTRIEGNRLTREQVREVVLHGETAPNRERDEAEAQVQTLHGLVMTSKAVPVSGRTERHP